MSDQGDRLRQARISAGYERPVDAAERFGWNPNTYKSNENGNAPFSFKKAKEYATAFGVRAEWLYDASGPAIAEHQPAPTPPLPIAAPGDPVDLNDIRAFLRSFDQPPTKRSAVGRLRPIERRIPVVGEVAAGIWKEAPVRQMQDVTDWLDMDVAGYERAELRAFKVSGPSMNLHYPEGRFVVTAHPAQAGLRNGDHVVVERHRADLTEITLKEFVLEPGGRIALWPRSSHPDFQAPIYLKGNGDENDQVGVAIVGVVVADYGRRERPPAPYVSGRAANDFKG